MQTWDLVQQALKLRTRETNIQKKIDLFSNKLYCVDCGKPLARKYNRKHEFIGYHCSTYKKFGNRGCSSHSCGDAELKDIILAEIKKVAIEILTPKDIDQLDNVSLDSSSDFCQIQIKQLEKSIQSIQGYIDKIYRDYLDEIISRDEYIKYKNDYISEQNIKKNELQHLKETIEENKSKNDNIFIWANKFKNYIGISELSREVLLELVDRIEIDAEGNIHIKFRFRR